MDTPDPLITCPYTQSHQILKSRMQYHLTKCRKSHPNAETEVCPFDATHHIPKPEIPFHLKVCPNRKVVESSVFVTTDSTEKAALPPYQVPSIPTPSENWDDDLVTSTYQPSEKAAEAPVLRQLIGATKSERKKFRLQERMRMQDLAEKGYCEPEGKASTSKISSPLRLPTQFVQSAGSSNMGLGRGGSAFSSDVKDPLSEFTSLSISRGRGVTLRCKNE